MLLTRFSYHAMVVGWLAVLCLVDVVANTALDGLASDIYFYKVFLDAGLIYWTALYLKEDLNGSVVAAGSTRARAAQNQMPADRGHEAIANVDLGKSEYIYYGFLVLYGIGNLYFHHSINKGTTGMESFATLILSMVDIAVAAVAGLNFYQVASGKFVRLQQRLGSQ